MINICDDVLTHIYSFIRPEWLYYTNKNYFENYLKDDYIISETSIRRLIRQDSYYVLDLLLMNNIDILIKHKRYIYRNWTYKNYVEFLVCYCIDNKSYKCTNIIKNKYGKYLIKNKKLR